MHPVSYATHALLAGLALQGPDCYRVQHPILSDVPAPEAQAPLPPIFSLLFGNVGAPPVVLLDSSAVVPPDIVKRARPWRWAPESRSGIAAALDDLARHRSQTVQPLDSATAAQLAIRVVSQRPPPLGRVALISSVGFNGDSTFAAIYLESSCGPKCGADYLELFGRHRGYRWTHIDEELLSFHGATP